MASSKKKSTSIFTDLKPTMASPPSDVRVESGFFDVVDGTDIFWRVWEGDTTNAVVVLVHGFMEHSARYHHFASALVRSGFAVFSFDYRGHGRSGGKRAFIRSFSDYTSDLEAVVKRAQDRYEGLPLHIFGHSYGGLISIHHAANLPQAEDVNSYAFTSPFVGLEDVPASKVLAGNILSVILPSVGLPTDMDVKWISRNEEVVRDYANDPMNLKIATGRWFTETKKAHLDIKQQTQNIAIPSLWIIAQSDEIAYSPAAEALVDKVKCEKTVVLLPDHYHEVLNELDWEIHAQTIIDWFGEHQ